MTSERNHVLKNTVSRASNPKRRSSGLIRRAGKWVSKKTLETIIHTPHKIASSPKTLGLAAATYPIMATYLGNMYDKGIVSTIGKFGKGLYHLIGGVGESAWNLIRLRPGEAWDSLSHHVYEGASHMYHFATNTLGLDEHIIKTITYRDTTSLAEKVVEYSPYIMVGIMVLAAAKYGFKKYVLENKNRREKLSKFVHALREIPNYPLDAIIHKIEKYKPKKPGCIATPLILAGKLAYLPVRAYNAVMDKLEKEIKHYKPKIKTDSPVRAALNYIAEAALTYGIAMAIFTGIYNYYNEKVAILKGASKAISGLSIVADFFIPKAALLARYAVKLASKGSTLFLDSPDLLTSLFDRTAGSVVHVFDTLEKEQVESLFYSAAILGGLSLPVVIEDKAKHIYNWLTDKYRSLTRRSHHKN